MTGTTPTQASGYSQNKVVSLAVKHSRLKDFKIREIIECFCLDINSTKTAELLPINRNTINGRFSILRHAVPKDGAAKDREKEKGDFELDESYFGAGRARGKRGRGAAGKTIVFGVLKRDDKAYLKIVPKALLGKN
jgi:transposase-like protein